MRIPRIGSTLTTGTIMLAGGIALTVSGPPAVIVLGLFCAVVGMAYTSGG